MKTKSFLRLAVILAVVLLCGFQFAEDPEFAEKLKARLNKYNSEYPEEKIYLQFDKPFYKPGEDIWFNAFILNSNSHKPTNLSEVLYVDLADPKGNIVSHLELIINDGTTRGDFKINAQDLGGIYKVQAYTNWMKNFNNVSSFKKDIQVQRVITPRLLLKLDFEREAYGPGDSVVAELTARNLKNELIRNAPVQFSVFINGQKTDTGATETDGKGNLKLRFVLPAALTTSDGLLQLVVTSKGVQESISRSIPIQLNKISMSFFPEGGNLIENVETRIAFKALNEFQKAADIEGMIIDDKGKTVTMFKSFHMGMGAFSFVPMPGRKYFARINSPATHDPIALPVAQPAGYTLRLTGRNDSATEFSIFAPANAVAWMTAQVHGTLYHTEKVTLHQGVNTANINTERFPAGIAVFTLFRDSGIPLCERLVYINPDRQLNITIKPDKDRYNPGEKVELKISTTDHKGKPVPAKISLSVADDQLITFADDKQDNLLSSMLLSSEVKGEIQEPSFYFDANEPKAKEALDYLLMTQGWRRFKWTEIDQPKIILSHDAEKVKTLSGSITSKDGKPVEDEVTLVELGNLKRIIKVRTNSKGMFSFRNTDPTVANMLLTGKQSLLNVNYSLQELQEYRNQETKAQVIDKDAVVRREQAPENVELEEVSAVPEGDEVVLELAMAADVQSLSEVVVVGYGTADRNDLVGSVTVVNNSELSNIAPLPAVENHLQGRVAGVVAQPRSASPGAAPQIRIRGTSTLAGGSAEPLYVIDGHPIGNSINYNFSNSSMLAADDIQSIEILHSPEATALFGSSAANGVIVITTKSGKFPDNRLPRNSKAKFASVIVQPRKFSVAREFYIEKKSNQNVRDDFRTTVYWNPEIITTENGLAKVSFTNTDAVSAFRITAEGFSSTGLLGHSETVFSTLLPLSTDAKLPAYLGFEDTLTIPVRVTNETSAPFTAEIRTVTGKGLSIHEAALQKITIKPGQSETVHYTLTTTNIAGTIPVKITVNAEGYSDEISQSINVQPVGFPMRASFSGKELERNVRFRITDAEAGTLKAELSAFPDVLSDLFTGAEGIFRQPYGCFEQTSSSTFPNILALQYLKRSGLVKPETEKMALDYIRKGYDRLISYEVRGGGFEWFGESPAHEALTAYGLIEFVEMEKVYPDVDDRIIDRTRRWLLSRRNGDGTFSQPNGGLDDFSRPSGDVSNAYITYALSETGEKNLDKEYTHNLITATSNGDMYLLALMANVAYNLDKKSDYDKLIHMLQKKASPAGFDNMTASHSVVWSQGESLTNETLALWALALMKDGGQQLDLVSKCINFLVSRRSGGMFGSTQATVLSLKALSEYALLARSTQHAGEIQVFVNEMLAESAAYAQHTRDKISMTEFSRQFSNDGDQKLKIAFNNTPAALPYSVNVYWHSKRPSSNEDCKVRISTNLNAEQIRVNETVRLTATVTNSASQGIPMTMAVIGIPAGLSAQPWQLKELQEKKIFDFYEINDGFVYVYYRQLKPKEVRVINFDLKGEIPGEYTGAASSAYLYYTDEHKDWAAGNHIKIKP
jgi:alpha-2-macroglobulin-like protein